VSARAELALLTSASSCYIIRINKPTRICIKINKPTRICIEINKPARICIEINPDDKH
jgi:hypothetical protein